jgi:hypothetical protein
MEKKMTEQELLLDKYRDEIIRGEQMGTIIYRKPTKEAELRAELLHRLGAVSSSPQPKVDEFITSIGFDVSKGDGLGLEWEPRFIATKAVQFFAPAPAQEGPKEVMPTVPRHKDSTAANSTGTLSANVASLKTSGLAAQPTLSLPKVEIYQQDWIPGFAAFRDDGEIEANAKAHVILNLSSFAGSVQIGDIEAKDVPYLIAESLMHEVIHVLEAWAKVEFSEERVEQLLTEYRHKYGVEAPVYQECETRPTPETQAFSGAAPGTPQVEEDSRNAARRIAALVTSTHEGCKTIDILRANIERLGAEVISEAIRSHLPGAPAQPAPEEKR